MVVVEEVVLTVLEVVILTVSTSAAVVTVLTVVVATVVVVTVKANLVVESTFATVVNLGFVVEFQLISYGIVVSCMVVGDIVEAASVEGKITLK